MQKIVLGIIIFFLALALYSIIDIISTQSTENEASLSTMLSPEELMLLSDLAEKKAAFIQEILPAVRSVKNELDAEYARALQLREAGELSDDDRAWLDAKLQEYDVKGMPCLLRRMHTHPVSLVIAQAALETGWGTSRFYKEANNIFGIWSYHEDEPRIPAAKNRDGNTTVYVKKYATLEASIRGYFAMISGGYAYAGFRKGRMETDNPFRLLRHLRRYSELRDEYVARLYYVMKSNQLYRYDDVSYAPIALSNIIPDYVAMKQKEEEARLLALNEIKKSGTESDDRNRTSECDEE